MSAPKKKDNKLLDNWISPAAAGEPIGCIATTFTFQSEFFEEECLTRFLAIESKPDEDGPVYLIEREEKMNSISCAAVWVDQAYAKQKRNLRWDLIPVRLTNSILHSKVAVLQWLNHTRIILGSGNLTAQAYRKNQEVFAVIDLSSENSTDKQIAVSLIQHLKNVINVDKNVIPQIRQKHITFLDGVVSFISQLPEDDSSLRKQGYLSFPLLIEPGGTPFPNQVMNLWNEHISTTPPEEVFITTPFFDPPGDSNKPAELTWELLKKKGSASINICTTGETDNNNQIVRIHAPEIINGLTPPNRQGVHISWSVISELDSEGKSIRPLHMKSYWFRNSEDFILYVIGSSNFTSKGWGLNTRGNYEANIAYITNKSKYPEQYKQIVRSCPDGTEIDPKTVKWAPLPQEDETDNLRIEPPLPAFFQNATLLKDGDRFIELRFTTSAPPVNFAIKDEEGNQIYSYVDWIEAGRPIVCRVPVDLKKMPAYLLVYLDGNELPACLVLNISDQDCLPAPEELKNLSLDLLAQIVTSALPMHQILGKYLLKINKTASKQQLLINPHDRVDVSTFLLQKTRRYSFAINMIQQKLELPCATMASLKWRLHGPVGMRAFVNAMLKEAGNNSNEAIFFLTELWTRLGMVKYKAAPGSLHPRIFNTHVREFRGLLAEQIKALWTESDIPSIKAYSKKVIQKDIAE